MRRTGLGKDAETRKTIAVRPFVTTPAKVGFSGTRTINLGNFNSVKVAVWIEMPCYVEEINTIYPQVKQFVEAKLQAEVDEILESAGLSSLA